MKKILYYTPYYVDRKMAAGVRAYHHIQALRQSHTDIVVLSSDSASQENLVTFFKNPSNKLPFVIRFLFELALGIELSIRLLIFKGKVILSSPPFFSTFLAGYCLKLFNREYFLDIRDLYPEVLFDYGAIQKNSFLGRGILALTKKVYDGASKIITVTDGLTTRVKEQAIFPQKVKTIRNGFDETLFFPKETSLDSTFKVIFHGNLGRFQNIDLLLDLAKHLDTPNGQVTITIAGSGPFESKIKAYRGKNLVFLGELPNEQMAKVIREHHLGISFRTDSNYNSLAFPVKVFEYIGSGLPVIATPISEAGIELKKFDCGFEFSNSELSKIVEKIEELKSNKELYSRLRKNASDARTHFTRQASGVKFSSEILSQ